ncbi:MULTISPECIES: threonine--tRNA ligase [Anaerotruncus]|uniref:Threonine--tRNA ligase n=2 Tax=Anaerotruncus TaxID=244127 RepID=A0A498CNC3_9FIRM|nr:MULTISPECIES: threonine--tRNA ligase [Anaerotruncus]MBC3939002.1 threonine--tRNA ligase [Anaerotruncus massiliensis (ex Togo et al. 2019)]MCQ4896852.1 threonine--tRNA ligase [Anaerotruncus sp. DFI.9.16]RLL10322.1 threonine--tRNA ligase [Anaerotruncus massiliensis (ex Liu et al. 2021)]
MINVTLKGGVVKEFESGTTAAEVAKSLGAGLYKAACAARVDGKAVDLRTPLTEDCTLAILTFDDPEGKHAFWHTASHVLAQAVMHLYPDTKYTIGPAVENGFYYDFDVEKPFTPEDLAKIEKEMTAIVKTGEELERFELDPADAKELMKDQPYKLELIDKHSGAGEKISFYKQGDFTDLCAGPHLMSVAPLKAIKLVQSTGAYWHGDSNNRMLCRVYGIAFPKASELESYLNMLEEAKRRDHRKLGRELDLFDIYEEGPGFPFFFPKGMVLRNTLESFWRELHRQRGYEEIRTPLILSEELWHRSGHWDHYKDNMYTTKIDDRDFAIKPMNCPGGMLVYKRKLHSYRDLPERMAELGIVHRHELSGALHGLMRVRCFTQDDAHIYMTPEQIEEEVLGVMDLIDSIYKVFGFEYFLELSTRPEDSMGTEEQWNMATEALRNALEKNGKPYSVNEGDGAFYGPKIDFHLRDCIGRTWQCGTIQLDFQMPERFDLTYTGKDGEKHRPVMLHRTALGSIERFIGILTEHYAGAFPLWLAPVQVKVLPVTDEHIPYAKKVSDALTAAGLRVETDSRNEKVGYRIREAQLQKIPYMLVLGGKEAEAGEVAVRDRRDGKTTTMSLEAFLEKAKAEVDSKAN